MGCSRHTEDGQDQGKDHAEMAAKRRVVMMEDRRRRLSGHLDGYDRTLSSSALSPGYQGTGQARQSRANLTSDGPGNPFPSRITDRPLPPCPNEGPSRDGQNHEISLPKWQPDEEITKCPICGTTFTFWYRKHHCRKCGRVVCANCSPHRITIPRQFIIHPPDAFASNPGTRTNAGIEVVDLTGDGGSEAAVHSERPQSSDYKIDPALGGGQEVRLCNPCVPDPNPLPHMPYPSSSHRPFAMHPRTDRTPLGQRHTSIYGQAPPQDNSTSGSVTRLPSGQQEYHRPSNNTTDFSTSLNPFSSPSNRQRNHAFHTANHAMSPPYLPTRYGSAPDQSAQQRHRSSHHHHRNHASMGPIPTTSRTFHVPELIPPALRSQAQPHLREEDECPICHGALPSKGLDGSEVAREAHVAACVEMHFSSSGPRTSHPPPSAATETVLAASADTPAQASGMAATFEVAHQHSAASEIAAPSSSLPPRRRTTGMVVYSATEKDCVGEDGKGEAECVICFEEFTVGEEMGRLECLCKFHRKCIRQWWDTKGPGACPVHQEST
ncbi:MAG: hypothetical protein Q9217_003606 [Psora testacea]